MICLLSIYIWCDTQNNLSIPPRHGRRSEGQESRLPTRERLNLGSLGVTVLELEGSAGEEVGDAGIADDDGAAGVGGDDAVLDWLVVVGAAV